MPRPKRYYSLARPKLRQSWNKYNLYNLANSRVAADTFALASSRTFFQQKWDAKSRTRAYHGEHISEKKWTRLFSRRLLSAVDMSPQYLALHDGSEQAAGRGSGLQSNKVSARLYSKALDADHTPSPRSRGPTNPTETLLNAVKKITPYMQMTYAPLERRLDSAVFRALFASSIRQARQMVVHGAVKVNGKKMPHPAYQLNPGDMFQVDVEKVLYATGKQKEGEAKVTDLSFASYEKSLEQQKQTILKARNRGEADGQEVAVSEAAVAAEAPGGEADAKAEEGEGFETAAAGEAGEVAALTPAESWELNNRKLNLMLKGVRKLLQTKPVALTATDKRYLRLFRDSARQFVSQGEGAQAKSKELMSAFQAHMKTHQGLRETYDTFTLPGSSKRDKSRKFILSPEGKKLRLSDVAPDSPEAAKIRALSNGGEEAPQTSAENREKQIKRGLDGLTDDQKKQALGIMGDAALTEEEMRNLARLLREDEENPIDSSKPYATPWEPRPYMSPFAFIPRYLEVNPNICAAVYLRHPVARQGSAEVPTPFTYITSQLAHNWYLRRR